MHENQQLSVETNLLEASGGGWHIRKSCEARFRLRRRDGRRRKDVLSLSILFASDWKELCVWRARVSLVVTMLPYNGGFIFVFGIGNVRQFLQEGG